MKVQGDLKLLNGGQLLNATVENLAADPVTPYAGQVWFNTTSHTYKGYNGTAIMQFASGGALNDYLLLTGGTLSGALYLTADVPVGDTEATNKKYVDDRIATREPNLNGAATSIAQSNLTASKVLVSDALGKVAVSTATTTELGYLDGVTSSIQTQINAQVAVAGDTMTGALQLPAAAPTADTEATNKKYVDDRDALKENVIIGAATSIVQSNLTASRAVASDASGKVTVSATTDTELGYLSGVTSSVQTQIDAQVSAAGDTMTGALLMGLNKITSSYVPVVAADVTNKAYVDSAIAKMNWQADVKAIQTDAVLDPGATPVTGDRYIITNAVALHANFGTIANVANGDIVEYDGTAFVIAYDVSAQGALADGTITWDAADAMFVRYYGTTWTEFGGMNATNAGIGLIKSGNIINVRLGAGIGELPTDEVGVEVFSAGGLFTTVDGSTESTATAATLSVKLDSTTLYLSATGLRVRDAGITETQLHTSVAGDGLTGGAGTPLAVGVSTGITVAANAIAFDETYGDTRYINTAGDTMTGTLTLNAMPTLSLEAATKGYVDQEIGTLNTTLRGIITTLETRVDAGYFLYTSSAPGTTHTVTHNMNRQFVNVTVVDSSNQVIIPQSVTYDSVNALTVVFNGSIDCKVVVGGVKPQA